MGHPRQALEKVRKHQQQRALTRTQEASGGNNDTRRLPPPTRPAALGRRRATTNREGLPPARGSLNDDKGPLRAKGNHHD